MSTVTKPIMKDETGQDLVAEAQNIVLKLQDLINAVKPTAADIPLAAISGMTADDVQEGVAELKSNLDLLQTRVGNIKSLQLITGTATTGSTGNIATGVTNDGKHLVFGAYASGANVYFNVFVSGINNGFYLKCKDVDTNQFIVNTSIAYRYYLLEMV